MNEVGETPSGIALKNTDTLAIKDAIRPTTELLTNYLGVSTGSENFGKWREANPELSGTEILVSCLYNKVTREQSLWTKRSDLTDAITHELDDYLHETSEITAEIVLSGKVSKDKLEELDALSLHLEDTARSEGVSPKDITMQIEPETNILSFAELFRQKKERDFLNGRVLVVGLTTHGDVPAYVVSKLLDEKGVENQIAFIRPTSRDNQQVVDILPRDRIVLESAVPDNVLIVDDSIDQGGSMRQSLDYLNNEFTQPKTVCVAVARGISFLSEIEEEEYTTEMHDGEKIYTRAAFFEQNSNS